MGYGIFNQKVLINKPRDPLDVILIGLQHEITQRAPHYFWTTATTLYILSDMSYGWEAEQWHIPVDAGLQQLFELGSIYASADVGAGYWADSPDYGPEGYRFKVQFTFVIPK